MSIRIAITDDHPMILNGLRNMLETQESFEVINIYENGRQLLEGIKKEQPDVLILDIHLPDITGEVLTRTIRQKYPDIRILILTSHDGIFFVKNLLSSGATGYILKTSGPEILIEAIKTVYAGIQFLSPEVKDILVNDTLKIRNKISNSIELTQREKDILQLIAEECTSQEIAEKLHLSHRTVENYRIGLMQKLNAKNMIGMIKRALQLGLVQ